MNLLLQELLRQHAIVAAAQVKLDKLAQRCADEMCIAKVGNIVESPYESRQHRKYAIVEKVGPVRVDWYDNHPNVPFFSCWVEGFHLNSRGEISRSPFHTSMPLRSDATGREEKNYFGWVVVG